MLNHLQESSLMLAGGAKLPLGYGKGDAASPVDGTMTFCPAWPWRGAASEERGPNESAGTPERGHLTRRSISFTGVIRLIDSLAAVAHRPVRVAWCLRRP